MRYPEDAPVARVRDWDDETRDLIIAPAFYGDGTRSLNMVACDDVQWMPASYCEPLTLAARRVLRCVRGK